MTLENKYANQLASLRSNYLNSQLEVKRDSNSDELLSGDVAQVIYDTEKILKGLSTLIDARSEDDIINSTLIAADCFETSENEEDIYNQIYYELLITTIQYWLSCKNECDLQGNSTSSDQYDKLIDLLEIHMKIVCGTAQFARYKYLRWLVNGRFA